MPTSTHFQPEFEGQSGTPRRSRLDAAILVSVLAMGLLNVLVITGGIGVTSAHAAVATSCEAPLA